MLDARDLDAQWELQRRIDAGASRFFILSPAWSTIGSRSWR